MTLPAPMQRYVDAIMAGRKQAHKSHHPLGPRYLIVDTGSYHKTTHVDQNGRTEKLIPLCAAVLNPRRQGKRYDNQ